MDWAEHKGKCFSEKNINAMLDRMDAEKAAKPVPRPSKKRCTGCGIQFPKYDEDEDECDEDCLADACDDCGECCLFTLARCAGLNCPGFLPPGYMCCEGCVSHHSRGSFGCYSCVYVSGTKCVHRKLPLPEFKFWQALLPHGYVGLILWLDGLG